MRIVFAFVILGERIEGGIILRKCGLAPNPNATLRELADKAAIETTGETVPSSRPWKAA